MKVAVLLLALIVIAASASNTTKTIWPKPETFSFEPNGEKVKVNPCSILFVIDSAQQPRVEKMISWYISSVFGCTSTSPTHSDVHLNININDETLVLPT